MSSISTSNDDYNNFNQRIRSIESEVEAEQKRNREAREKDRAKLEASYSDAIERKNQDLEKTLNNVRDRNEDSSARERGYSQATYDDLKHRTYDRFAQYAREGAMDKKQLADRVDMEKAENDLRSQREERKLDQLYRSNEERVKDQATYYSGALSQMAKDRAKSEGEHAQEFTRALNREHESGQHAMESAEKAFDRHTEDLTQKSEDSLRQQARTQEESLSRQRVEDNEKISLLEKNVQQRSTGGDRSLVDPAVEEQIRADVGGQYEKVHQAEYQRDQNGMESLRHNNQLSTNQLSAENETRARVLNQQFTAESDHTRADHLNEIQDLQQAREETIRTKDDETNRQAETLNRNFGNALERQHRDFDDQLSKVRSEAAEKVATARQDAEASLRAVQRDFNTRQSAMVREYTKKLQDQKNTYDDQVRDLKAQMAKLQDDTTHASKQLLEDQQRQNDKRYAQLEVQSKERERTISDSYEDQLDKVRRANILLQQRKS